MTTSNWLPSCCFHHCDKIADCQESRLEAVVLIFKRVRSLEGNRDLGGEGAGSLSEEISFAGLLEAFGASKKVAIWI